MSPVSSYIVQNVEPLFSTCVCSMTRHCARQEPHTLSVIQCKIGVWSLCRGSSVSRRSILIATCIYKEEWVGWRRDQNITIAHPLSSKRWENFRALFSCVSLQHQRARRRGMVSFTFSLSRSHSRQPARFATQNARSLFSRRVPRCAHLHISRLFSPSFKLCGSRRGSRWRCQFWRKIHSSHFVTLSLKIRWRTRALSCGSSFASPLRALPFKISTHNIVGLVWHVIIFERYWSRPRTG